MTFVLTMLFTFVYDHKNENHWLLLIIGYSLLITHYSLLITHYLLLIIRNTNTPLNVYSRC